jgi:hypothetical protein
LTADPCDHLGGLFGVLVQPNAEPGAPERIEKLLYAEPPDLSRTKTFPCEAIRKLAERVKILVTDIEPLTQSLTDDLDRLGVAGGLDTDDDDLRPVGFRSGLRRAWRGAGCGFSRATLACVRLAGTARPHLFPGFGDLVPTLKRQLVCSAISSRLSRASMVSAPLWPLPPVAEALRAYPQS